MSTLDAYMAGLMDGEGTFSIQVSQPPGRFWLSPRMSMSLRYGTEVLELLVEELGGNTYAKGANQRAWVLGRRTHVLAACERLMPYLRIKRDICQRFYDCVNEMPSRKGKHMNEGERVWTMEQALAVVRVAHDLNPPTGRWPKDLAAREAQVRAFYGDES
jgi:hypothetical protein